MLFNLVFKLDIFEPSSTILWFHSFVSKIYVPKPQEDRCCKEEEVRKIKFIFKATMKDKNIKQQIKSNSIILK